MKILALDPSSTVTGYAVHDGHLIDAGRLLPKRTRDPANARIEVMVSEVLSLVSMHRPDVVLVEDTSGKVSGRHGGMGAGLAIHGKAVGWVLGALAAAVPSVKVEAVPENAWTRGRKKVTRQANVALAYPSYHADADPGGDVSDAIGLADYWLNEQRMKG